MQITMASFYVGAGNRTQVLMLEKQALYGLSYLPNLIYHTFLVMFVSPPPCICLLLL